MYLIAFFFFWNLAVPMPEVLGKRTGDYILKPKLSGRNSPKL